MPSTHKGVALPLRPLTTAACPESSHDHLVELNALLTPFSHTRSRSRDVDCATWLVPSKVSWQHRPRRARTGGQPHARVWGWTRARAPRAGRHVAAHPHPDRDPAPHSGDSGDESFCSFFFLMYHNEQETYVMKYFQRSIFNYHLQSTQL